MLEECDTVLKAKYSQYRDTSFSDMVVFNVTPVAPVGSTKTSELGAAVRMCTTIFE